MRNKEPADIGKFVPNGRPLISAMPIILFIEDQEVIITIIQLQNFALRPLWLMRSRNSDSKREKHLKTPVDPYFLELISFAKARFLTLTIRFINAMVRTK